MFDQYNKPEYNKNTKSEQIISNLKQKGFVFGAFEEYMIKEYVHEIPEIKHKIKEQTIKDLNIKERYLTLETIVVSQGGIDKFSSGNNEAFSFEESLKIVSEYPFKQGTTFILNIVLVPRENENRKFFNKSFCTGPFYNFWFPMILKFKDKIILNFVSGRYLCLEDDHILTPDIKS